MQNESLSPRDVVKLAFQFQASGRVPYSFSVSAGQQEALTRFYGDASWRDRVVPYLGGMSGVGNFLSYAGMTVQNDGTHLDCLGCSWRLGSTHHLVDWPLHEPEMGSFRLPDLAPYFQEYLQPKWPAEIRESERRFRIISHSFGLFERAWSLRGFEDFLMDLAVNESFAEELLEHITEWFLQSIDLMAHAPVDAIMLTDDHAGQRGMLMGKERLRRLFKPRWKRIFARIHHYGLYPILHMCGDTTAVVPDLIDVGLDCMESCQPECMDIYALKKNYGGHIRFWGGLGAQSTYPFGTPEEVRREVRRLKREMGRGGGYILNSAKPPDENTPVENIAAYLEQANTLE